MMCSSLMGPFMAFHHPVLTAARVSKPLTPMERIIIKLELTWIYTHARTHENTHTRHIQYIHTHKSYQRHVKWLTLHVEDDIIG